MQDVLTTLKQLSRPRLLMRAARIGAEDYRRAAHLPRLLGYGAVPRHSQALIKLIEIEAEANAQRIGEESSYNLLRHIDILIAIVGEARILQAAQPGSDTRQSTGAEAGQEKPSGSSALRLATYASSASRLAGSSAGC